MAEVLGLEAVRRALAEDCAAADVTTRLLGAAVEKPAALRFVAEAACVVAGLPVVELTFRELDPSATLHAHVADGGCAEPDAIIATVSARAGALLSGERVALNFLQRLSGIATLTRRAVDAVAGTGGGARITHTRKTTPGLRALEKYAVRAGGGANHRFGLDDAVLIKDNHRALAGGLRPAVERARGAVGHLVKIEVEVDSLAELDEALALGVDAVLLDNMDLATLGEAVRRARGRALTEASGGIRPATAAAIAATGVDLLSVGWLTHSAPALDVALDVAL